MGKRHRRAHGATGRDSGPNQHYENLVKLREQNPQAYERLGDATHQTIEKYQLGQLAQTFEQHPGNESLLELSRRLPEVFARLSQSTRDEVERYAARRRAFDMVNEEEARQRD
jgi:broad specificity phosphatase PhoE